jgi:hypothetical protein
MLEMNNSYLLNNASYPAQLRTNSQNTTFQLPLANQDNDDVSWRNLLFNVLAITISSAALMIGFLQYRRRIQTILMPHSIAANALDLEAQGQIRQANP